MLNYILYRIGRFVAVRTPLKLAYRIGIFISDLHYCFVRQDRRAVYENLKVIFPDAPDKEIRRIRVRLFRNFAKYLVDFFRFETLNNEYIAKYIRIENSDYFTQASAGGKGVVVVTAHLGNWELGGVVIALSGYPFWAVALPHKNKKVDAFFNSQRASKGVRIIPLGRAVRMCLDLLKENKFVALVGDRDFAEKGIILDFFGKPAIFPAGPAAFALKTGAPILPGFMVRNSDDTFTLRMEPPIIPHPTGDNDADMRALIGRYKLIFERYIREYPDQWYMFRRFWVSRGQSQK